MEDEEDTFVKDETVTYDNAHYIRKHKKKIVSHKDYEEVDDRIFTDKVLAALKVNDNPRNLLPSITRSLVSQSSTIWTGGNIFPVICYFMHFLTI